MTAYQTLELPRILEEIAAYASCAETHVALQSLTPHVEADALERDKRYVVALVSAIDAGRTLPTDAIEELNPLFHAVAREGAVLDVESLQVIRRFLNYAAAVLAFCESDENAPLNELVETVIFPAALRERLAKTITPDGEISEEAIPELRRLKGEIGRLNRALLRRAEEILRGDPHLFHGEQPTIRDGRTVLPLAANFKGRIDGIVHESSGSGETLFVEPRDLVDLNNDLAHAHHAIHREIQRLLRELSAMVRDAIDEIGTLAERVFRIDGYIARARWGHANDGVVIAAGEVINLREARHPLLGAECVPVSIAFEQDVRIVVISGPNTGGKTVLMKTVGLLSLLHQCAVPIPVAPDSTLPLFDYWGVDIGDEQSIDEHLSTFSAHMRVIASIVATATHRSLVLLDELGTGTDPDEGAALSMAIVDELIGRGSTVLASTHQTVLKHYGYTRDAARNVSMAFDEDTHRPTYRVVPGRPGASHAIETAAEQGIPREIIARARSYAADNENSVSEIINRLLEYEAVLQGERDRLAEESRRLAAEKNDITTRRKALDEREAQLRREGVADLERTIRDARRTIEGEVRRLREGGRALSKDEIKDAHRRIESIESYRDREYERIDDLSRTENGERDEPQSGDATERLERPAQAGDTVIHRRTNRSGEVKTIRRGKAEVQFGGVRMTVPLDELVVTVAGKDGGVTYPRSVPRSPRFSSGHALFELDVRGQRLHEAVAAVQHQVDEAVAQGLTSISIIHGTGTGVLQKGVRDYLASRGEVAAYRFARPEDGGFGKTVVELSTAAR